MNLETIAHEDGAAVTVNEGAGFGSGVRTTDGAARRAPSDFLKRAMDLCIAIPMAIFLVPAFIALAIIVYLDDPGPILFRHRRRGAGGKHFECVKFRTMVRNADRRLQEVLDADPALRREWEANHKLKDDPRLTGVGGVLRRYSLDELPQLWNIIRGEMSIVGPRPIVDDEVRRYGDDIEYYNMVRPGVIGLWQISGRSDTTYAERVEMDVEYAQRRNIFLDIGILISSIPAILSRKGAY